MTRSEYQKMIKKSAVFGYLSKDFKDEALKASADDMARYASIFSDANSLMARADTDMRAANDEVLRQYRQGLKEKNAGIEDETRKREEESQENLLEELKNT